MVKVYWFVEGIRPPDSAIEIEFPDNRVIRCVRLAACQLPAGGWASSDDPDVCKWLLRGVSSLDLGNLQLAMGLRHVELDLSREEAKLPFPQLDSVGLHRGVLEIECRSQHISSPADYFEDLRLRLKPLIDLMSLAQRRPCVLRDGVVVDSNSHMGLHETREPAASPRGGYGALVDRGSLMPFLSGGLAQLDRVSSEQSERLRLSLAFHRVACAQRAVIESRLVEHLGALDILTHMLAGRGRHTQLEQFKKACGSLRKGGWPGRLLPPHHSLKFLVRVRNDLAHARCWEALKVGSPKHNRKKVIRATEICVTLLEACVLHVLGFSPSGPQLRVNLPFRLGGWQNWYLLGENHP